MGATSQLSTGSKVAPFKPAYRQGHAQAAGEPGAAKILTKEMSMGVQGCHEEARLSPSSSPSKLCEYSQLPVSSAGCLNRAAASETAGGSEGTQTTTSTLGSNRGARPKRASPYTKRNSPAQMFYVFRPFAAF
jgi:hypothetical protein